MNHFITPLFKKHNIYFIQGKNKGKIPYTNALLINDTLFDTGISPLYLKKLRKSFEIKTIIFSHWHDDHIRDNKIFEDCEFLCHEKAKPIIEDIDRLIDLYDIRNTIVEAKFKEFLSNYIDVYGTKINKSFKNGDILNLGKDFGVQVIYTPGHCIGHTCFYIPSLKFLFLSDIDLSVFGPWYGGLDSDILEFKKSIDKVSKFDIEIVITGHSGLFRGSKIIKKRLEQYQKIFDVRETLILNHLNDSKPLKAQDLVEKKIIYRNYEFFKPFLLRMERTMIQKHLNKLLSENKINLVNSGYVIS
jgi:glyoxylase-like metal-dependent hydrolase (beta-lactamase superfamily II)